MAFCIAIAAIPFLRRLYDSDRQLSGYVVPLKVENAPQACEPLLDLAGSWCATVRVRQRSGPQHKRSQRRMSKEKNTQKPNDKKKPQKTLKEKRQAKRDKHSMTPGLLPSKA